VAAACCPGDLKSLKVVVAACCLPARPCSLHVVNPKAIPVAELYGVLDSDTRDWTDGLLSRIFRWVRGRWWAAMGQTPAVQGFQAPLTKATV